MSNKGVTRQLLAAFAGSTSMMSMGIAMGWSSPIMKELLGPNGPIPMTVDQSSWFVALMNLGIIVGSVPFSAAADRWGRLSCLRAVAPAALALWIALLFVTTFEGLLVVRFAQGLLAGGVFTVAPVYGGEIAGPGVRGALGTLFSIMLFVGIAYVYAAGMWLDYRRLTYAAAAGPALSCALLALVPESPHFYAMRDRPAAAKRAAEWLRGGGAADDGTGDRMMADDGTAVDDGGTGRTARATFVGLFADRANLGSLIVVLALSVFRIAAGLNSLIMYGSMTLAETRVDADPNALSLVFVVSVIASSVPAAALADRAGRRPLMIASCALCSLFDAAVCAYFYADRRTGYDVAGHGWLCVLAIGGLAAAHTLGYGSVHCTIVCELFPSDQRSLANALSTVTMFAASFLACKAYPVLAVDGGMYRNYLISTLFGLASVAFCWLWLPETKGAALAAVKVRRGDAGRSA